MDIHAGSSASQLAGLGVEPADRRIELGGREPGPGPVPPTVAGHPTHQAGHVDRAPRANMETARAAVQARAEDVVVVGHRGERGDETRVVDAGR